MLRTRALVICAAFSVGLLACGDDDGGEVTVLDDGGGSASGGSASGGSASGGESASGADSGSASGVEAATCTPVGTELEASADETVPIGLTEYAFDPATVEVAAGTVTFVATNQGGDNHELAFLPGGGDIPLTDAGAPDEDALAAQGAFELEAFPPGGSCNATYELTAGTYTLFCIVEAADGQTHASKGMVGTLTVA
jgi:plastocyanin